MHGVNDLPRWVSSQKEQPLPVLHHKCITTPGGQRARAPVKNDRGFEAETRAPAWSTRKHEFRCRECDERRQPDDEEHELHLVPEVARVRLESTSSRRTSRSSTRRPKNTSCDGGEEIHHGNAERDTYAYSRAIHYLCKAIFRARILQSVELFATEQSVCGFLTKEISERT